MRCSPFGASFRIKGRWSPFGAKVFSVWCNFYQKLHSWWCIKEEYNILRKKREEDIGVDYNPSPPNSKFKKLIKEDK